MARHVIEVERGDPVGPSGRRWWRASCSCRRYVGRWERTLDAARREHRRHRRRAEAAAAKDARRRQAGRRNPPGLRTVTPPAEVDRILAEHAAARLVERLHRAE